jgi:hypothetical protein
VKREGERERENAEAYDERPDTGIPVGMSIVIVRGMGFFMRHQFSLPRKYRCILRRMLRQFATL